MPILEFRCRHRFAAGFELDVDFELTHRFSALFGPSGAGKSTILGILAGFLRPDEGLVRLQGRTLLDTSAGVRVAEHDRSVGMVFQDALLFPHLSVEGNLRYGQRHRKAQRRAINFSRVVDVLEIGGLLGRDPRNLSGGERQRVALGRALLSGPEILLLDEPLAALDAGLRTKILSYLERVVAEWDVPALYVTHSQLEVRHAAEWVVVLGRGRIVAQGLPDDALTQPEPLEWGNDAGPVNLVRLDAVEVSESRLTARIGDQRLFLPPGEVPSGAPLFVQFLPSDVILARHDVTGLSARNHLRGRICRVRPTSRAVFVAIDIGQVFWAEVTPEAARELELEPDREVVCFVKAHQLSVVA
jgi:molybdate transport system ATP-binding protein